MARNTQQNVPCYLRRVTSGPGLSVQQNASIFLRREALYPLSYGGSAIILSVEPVVLRTAGRKWILLLRQNCVTTQNSAPDRHPS